MASLSEFISNLGDPSEELQATSKGMQEVVKSLAFHGHCETKVGKGKAGHEDRTFDDLPGPGVDMGELLPGEVHEEFFPGFMGQHHGGGEHLHMLGKMVTELGISVSIGMLFDVLLPQEIPCDADLFELFDIMIELLTEKVITGVLLIGRVSPMEFLLQFHVLEVEKFLKRSVEQVELPEVFLHGITAHPEYPRDRGLSLALLLEP